MTIEICTSHFNENLGWLEKSPWPVSIVHHEGGTPIDCAYYTIPNIGFETTSYLKYIIERYDSLPDHVAFIHGHETAPHQLGDRPMLDMIRDANIQKYDYVPLNNCWRCVNSMVQMTIELEFVNKHSLPKPADYFITCCGAQFIVSKKALLTNTKKQYQHMYSVTIEKNEAIYFELCWHLIFGCGSSIVPYVDHFTPMLSEILYHTSGNIPMVLSKYKPCFIGFSQCLDTIHITNQAEYDYYSIRGGTFYVKECLKFYFKIDENKLIHINNKTDIIKNINIFEEIVKTILSTGNQLQL
jgi:hypothetical protein